MLLLAKCTALEKVCKAMPTGFVHTALIVLMDSLILIGTRTTPTTTATTTTTTTTTTILFLFTNRRTHSSIVILVLV